MIHMGVDRFVDCRSGAVDKAIAKIKKQLEKFLTTKVDKIVTKEMKKFMKPLSEAKNDVSELEQQLEENMQEVADKFDTSKERSIAHTSHTHGTHTHTSHTHRTNTHHTHIAHTPHAHRTHTIHTSHTHHTHISHTHITHTPHTHRYDRLLQELDVKMGESVSQVATKLKKAVGSLNKRAKKFATDLTKINKNVEVLGSRLKQNNKRRRKIKQEDVQVQEKPQATTTPSAFPRQPTPIINPDSQWFRIPESPCITRGVSPTPRPQYVSPMYASRNYMR